jgi:tRNA pseudouridine55 synthase
MNGIVNVLKPGGMTSSNVVSALRRITSIKRIGHTGTLDPGAAGVLPVCIGKATKLSDYLMDKGKQYIAELRLGWTTDTQDSYGTVIQEHSVKDVEQDAFCAVLERFVGAIKQTVPIYSAVKVNGQKLYKMAYKGAAVELPQKEVVIQGIAFLGKMDKGTFRIRVDCSKGTYIRTLCTDIAKALGTGAYMTFLLRTRSGAFDIADAYTIEEIEALFEEGRLPLMAPDYPLQGFRAVEIAKKYERFLKNGNPVPRPAELNVPAEQERVRVYCGGLFYGIGCVGQKDIRIKTLLISN